jgi:hypothetical protein
MLRFLPLFAILFSGCPTDPCTPLDTRCVRTRAEICGSDGVWRTMMDCEAEGMVCCWMAADLDLGIPEGYSCLPECPAVAEVE